MEKTPPHTPEKEIQLPLEEQYKIMASSILLDALILIGDEYSNNPPAFKPSISLQAVLGIAEVAYQDPSRIGAHLHEEDEKGRNRILTDSNGRQYTSYDSSVKNAGMQLGISDNDVNLAGHFIAAVGLAAKDEYWASIARTHNMERFTESRQDISAYLCSNVLPLVNDSIKVIDMLCLIRRDAEFYLGQYDTVRL